MDFQFSPQQELLRKSIREFAEGAIAPKVAHMEETDEVPWDLYKEMGKQQYMGILTPKEFGGSAMGHLARMIMLEEVGRVSAANGHGHADLSFGNRSDRGIRERRPEEKIPSGIGQGRTPLATIAVTEATGGSDPRGSRRPPSWKGITMS